MRRAVFALALSLAVGGSATGLRGQQVEPQATPTFKSSVNLITLNVVVRDRNGAIVKGLTAADFELLEDGVRQDIASFTYDEIGAHAAPVSTTTTLPGTASATPAAGVEPRPLTSEDVAGHRMVTLLFDTSSMEPDDVQRAIDGATSWVDTRMSDADLVAVAAIGSSLQILSDFTTDREQVRAALGSLSAASGTAFASVDSSTASSDAAAQTATEDTTAVDASAQELDTFNNDVRLRAIKTLAAALQPIQQKKAILYFSAGMQRSGTDNQVELRAAVNAALRANVAIYPVDARGLQAVVPGGSARQAGRGGLGAFSGSNVANQFSQLAEQQETLTALASDTGGTAFTDSNDFGEAFARIERDISAYYMIGFSSTNTARDGRFRRIAVRVRGRGDLRVQTQNGYYAERDFAHTGKSDREAQLQEQLAAPIPSTDVPLFVTALWFRLASDRYFVSIAAAVPGAAVPAGANGTTLDVAGVIRDERGAPVGRVRETLPIKATDTQLATRQVLYQTGITLPPGRFSVKVVVRENGGGLTGSFEAPIVVPDLKQVPMKVSSLVLSTQLRDAGGKKSISPLAKGGGEIVPNLTHIVGRDQAVYFYYEVYDPAVENGAPRLQTSLAFYRGKTRVFETPLVERTALDAPERKAALFQLELPPGNLTPGLYTCQVNIVDQAGSRFAFPRMQIYVR